MPTVTIHTNASLLNDEKKAILSKASDFLSSAAKVPREYVHITIIDGLTMSFAADVSKTAQVVVLTCPGQLQHNTRQQIAVDWCDLLDKYGILPSRVQVAFPTLGLSQLAIGGLLLNKPVGKKTGRENGVDEYGEITFEAGIGKQLQNLEMAPMFVMFLCLMTGFILQNLVLAPQEVVFGGAFGVFFIGLLIIGILRKRKLKARKAKMLAQMEKKKNK
ncbi:hypothetical protein AAMO2058_000382800 [Amorphochlora amoebiformis]